MTSLRHLVPPLAARGHSALTRDALVAWGEALGHAVEPPLLVTLTGDLGTGKTTLAQAICRGYGVTEAVTSPTFALVQTYAAPRSPVHHLDLYRLEREDELEQLGFDEIVASHALVIIEWPERAGARLPPAHLPIQLAHLPVADGATDDTRRVLLAG